MTEDIPKIGCVNHDCDRCAMLEMEIKALEEKLAEVRAQPEQEPVAWMQNTTAGLYVIDHYDERHCIPLYTTPPQRKPLTKEEIDGVMKSCINDWGLRPHYARAIETKRKEKNT